MTHITAARLAIASLFLVASSALAEPAQPAQRIRMLPPTASQPLDEQARAAFSDALRWSLEHTELAPGRGYVLSPRLALLRSFLEDGQRTPTFSCVVEIAISDEQGVLIATVRGSARGQSATARETLRSASDSAVRQLGTAFAMNENKRTAGKRVAAR